MIARFVTVLLAFGANLGDRENAITSAQKTLATAKGITEFKSSPLHETVAFGLEGPNHNAPKYLNGVATAVTNLGAHELLDLIQSIENEHGRTRETRWGDRTLDIDLILYGGQVIKDDRLTVPHPRAFERDFVLSPWLALDPGAVLMGHGPVVALLDRVGDTTTPYIPKADSNHATESANNSVSNNATNSANNSATNILPETN